MYKDPLKQREACKLSMQRLRTKRKGVTEGITVIPGDVIPLRDIPVIPVIPKHESTVIPDRTSSIAFEIVENVKERPPLTKSEQVKGRFKE